jgi:hypothetical protein
LVLKKLISSVVLAILLGNLSASGYWQQEVHYKIDAEFRPKEDKIIGQQTLIYSNNSPDTLNTVYFHLYLNAFQPGSPMDHSYQERDFYWLSNLPRSQWGSMEIKELRVNDHPVYSYQTEFTVMSVQLSEPLLPDKQATFYLEFEDKIPTRGARMGKLGRHYDIGQWYPRIAVYDRFGWHNDHYLGSGEFYGDFGTFEVNFTAPGEYIIAHTGRLLNQEELFPGLPKAAEDTILFDILRKYQEPKDSTQEKEIIATRPAKGGNHDSAEGGADAAEDTADAATRTWKIRAERVHDLFLAADPDFVWDRAQLKNTTINAFYTRDVMHTWKDAARETRFCLKFLSQKLGPYPYDQFSTVAGAVRGGMEYPQIVTMSKRIGGQNNHRFFSILAHEVAHNWFYGLLGSNQVRQACMDEGFTSFATVLLMEARYGRHNNFYTWPDWIQRKFYANDDERSRYARDYLKNANRKKEEPIDTHSDRFVDPGNYTLAVYTKTASVLFMLQYVLGDSLFDLAMKEYYQKWRWKHPYLDDFQQVAEGISNLELDWFFQQWFEKTWRLDYGIAGVKSRRQDNASGSGYLTQEPRFGLRGVMNTQPRWSCRPSQIT